uniref:Bestrophin homolog n=1 Tax=Caenorhabditis tropicalis TaxID=1561998 RepID=A0A1I7T0N7_9PELO
MLQNFADPFHLSKKLLTTWLTVLPIGLEQPVIGLFVFMEEQIRLQNYVIVITIILLRFVFHVCQVISNERELIKIERYSRVRIYIRSRKPPRYDDIAKDLPPPYST